MMCSKVVEDLFTYIEEGMSGVSEMPVHSINALGSGPLAYRTFGGNFILLNTSN